MKKSIIKTLVVASICFIVGACNSVNENSQFNTAKNQLRTKGVPFTSVVFIDQAAQGNVETVKLFLDAGMDVNVMCSQTALIAAAKNGQLAVAKTLIDNGADVNKADYIQSPLFAAIEGKHYDVVKYLLDNGADVNGTAGSYYRPILCVARVGDAKITGLLIDSGADVNYVQPVSGKTALLDAALHSKDNVALIEELVKGGADVNYKDHNGIIIIDWALFGRNFNIVKYLIEHGANINAGNGPELAPISMIFVLALENTNMIEYFVNHGASVNAKYNGYPILVWCARVRLDKSAEKLIQLGANVHATDPSGNAAIDYAIYNGSKDLVKALDPSIDVSKIQPRPVDPNLQPFKEQLKSMIAGKYYDVDTSLTQEIKAKDINLKEIPECLPENVDVNSSWTKKVDSNLQGIKKEGLSEIDELDSEIAAESLVDLGSNNTDTNTDNIIVDKNPTYQADAGTVDNKNDVLQDLSSSDTASSK